MNACIAGKAKSDSFLLDVGHQDWTFFHMSKFLRTKFLCTTKKSVRFGNHRIPFLLFPDDVIPLAASIGDTLEWWFEATHKVCRLQSFQCSTSKGANWDGSGIWPGHHLCFGHVQLEGDSWAHKGHAIEMMSLSWLTNTFDSHQMGWRSLSRCVKVHDALIILHNKQDSPCVKAMRPLLLLSSTLIVWWNLPQTPGRLCKWLILTFRLFSKALSSVSEAYWLPSHCNWSRWRVQVALVQMAHYLQHIALTAAAASFTQTVSTWLSPADLNLLIKTQWAHFKSSSLRSRSAAGLKREVLKWLC